MPPETEAAAPLVPVSFARQHRLVPLGIESGRLRVGFEASPRPALVRELAFLTGREITACEAASSEIDAYLEEAGAASAETGRPRRDDERRRGKRGAGERGSAAAPEPTEAPEPFADLKFEGAAARQVDRIIEAAIEAGASDVHLEPFESELRVRYRLDGALHAVAALPPGRSRAVASRIKILAQLDIAERRRPQDGRITAAGGGGAPVDLRVSTLPTAFGEKVVLRVLDRRDVSLDLGALGLGAEERQVFEGAVGRPHGMVLVTGPTGSGKTTTLYAALQKIARPAVNVQTIEDPVEYHLPGVSQAQVKTDIGFTFAEALRAFLRQDPDVIMVGEIRDKETAEIAVRAALTGHLVLSTLHTNDAPGAASRLTDMGVAPYLVASALRLVAAQRLVRRVCPECRAERPLKASESDELGLPAGALCAVGAGCADCRGTGYRGRRAVFELMPVSEPLAERIAACAGTRALRKEAQAEEMTSLRAAAARLVAEGITTPEEALRQTVL